MCSQFDWVKIIILGSGLADYIRQVIVMLFGIRHKLNKKHFKFGDKVSATIATLNQGSLVTDLLTAMATKRVMSKLGLVLNKKMLNMVVL